MESPSPTGDQFDNRALFQRSTDAIFVLNKNRRLRYANPAWESLVGKKLKEIYGLRCTHRRTDSSLTALARALNPPPEALTGSPTRVRRPVPGARLGPPWWEISFFPLAGAEGLLGIIGTVRVIGTGAAPKNRAIPEAVQRLRHRLADRYRFGDLESEVPACRHTLDQARLASKHIAPVTIIGEPGAGKQMLARAIHYEGISAERFFLAIDCPALPASTIELLLFGDCGLLHPERIGTVLLREPAFMHRDLQERLLDWLGKQTENVPRLAATFNHEPEIDVKADRLMKDLYLALAVQTIRLVPLRERLEDLSRLAASMLDRIERLDGHKIGGLTDESLEMMRAYHWPGNLRELDFALRHAARLANSDAIKPEHFPQPIRQQVSRAESVAASPSLSGRDAISLDESLTRVERRLIIQAMARAKGLHETAAKLLGIWRTRLGRRLKALKIEDAEWQRFVSPEADGDALPPDRGI